MIAVTMKVHAEDGERYAPDAFDRHIGKEVVVVAGTQTGVATVVAAQVVDGGRAAILTIDHGRRAKENADG